MTHVEQGRVRDPETKHDGKQVPSREGLMETVIHLIALSLSNNGVKIKRDTPLLSGEGVFDSVALLEFVLRLEDTFNISIPDEHLDPDVFQSPETVVSYLRGRLEQNA